MKTYADRHEEESKIKRKKNIYSSGNVKRKMNSMDNEDIHRMSTYASAPFGAMGIQRKMDVSQPGDHSEMQADEVAESFMSGNHGAGTDILSHQTPEISRMGEGEGMQTSDAFDQQLESTKGQGTKLDEGLKGELEEHTGKDLTNVKVHTGEKSDSLNRQVGAIAFTKGNDIHFTSGAYDPGSEKGRELITHEVAHTAQQGQAAIQPKIHRFEAWEHFAMGQEGYGTGKIKLSDYIEVSFGELTAMSGDYFETPGEIKQLANIPGSEQDHELPPSEGDKDYYDMPGTVDELWYIIKYHIQGERDFIKQMFSEKVRAAVDDRMMRLLSTNYSHFSNSTEKDTGKSFEYKANMANYFGKLPNNEKAYRINHERAIVSAFRAGSNNKEIDGPESNALLYEGFASHFLTDAYAAGHIRTQRISINEHWNRIYPAFKANMENWFFSQLTKNMPVLARAGAALATLSPLSPAVMAAVLYIKHVIGAMCFTFGDLIGGVIHDHDNKYGVMAKVGDKTVKLLGDNYVMKKDDIEPTKDGAQTFTLATDALKKSIAEVEKAYTLGKDEYARNNGPILNPDTGEPTDSETILSSVRHREQTANVTEKEGDEMLYAAELLWPVAAEQQEKDTQQLNWKVNSLEQLYADPEMSKAIVEYSRGTVVNGITGFQKDMSKFKRNIFGNGIEEIIKKLSGDEEIIKATLSEIVHYSPVYSLKEEENKEDVDSDLTIQQRSTQQEALGIVDSFIQTKDGESLVLSDGTSVIVRDKSLWFRQEREPWSVEKIEFGNEVKKQIQQGPGTFYQGNSMLCETMLPLKAFFIKLDPAGYAEIVIQLYSNGEAKYQYTPADRPVTLTPSEGVLNDAANLNESYGGEHGGDYPEHIVVMEGGGYPGEPYHEEFEKGDLGKKRIRKARKGKERRRKWKKTLLNEVDVSHDTKFLSDPNAIFTISLRENTKASRSGLRWWYNIWHKKENEKYHPGMENTTWAGAGRRVIESQVSNFYGVTNYKELGDFLTRWSFGEADFEETLDAAEAGHPIIALVDHRELRNQTRKVKVKTNDDREVTEKKYKKIQVRSVIGNHWIEFFYRDGVFYYWEYGQEFALGERSWLKDFGKGIFGAVIFPLIVSPKKEPTGDQGVEKDQGPEEGKLKK